MIDIKKFIKGLTVKEVTDTTKQLTLTVSPSATTNTTTTIVAAQTANRTITLPDADGTLLLSAMPLSPNAAVITDADGALITSVVSSTELANLNNSTENVQTAINDIRVIDNTQNDRLNSAEGNITALQSNKIDTGASLGAGNAIYTSETGTTLNFKSIVAGTNVTITNDANTVTINSAGGGGGANTTLSNLTSPTAINQSLVPNGTLNLGTAANPWTSVFTPSIKDTSGNTIIDVAGRRVLDASAVVKFDWSGTDISVNTHKITNVVNPTNPQDAATKAYVDAGGGSGANTTLSNLTSPVAANQNISPDGTFNARNLGTNINAWNRVWSYQGFSMYDGSTGFDSLTATDLKLGSNADSTKLRFQDPSFGSGWSALSKQSPVGTFPNFAGGISVYSTDSTGGGSNSQTTSAQVSLFTGDATNSATNPGGAIAAISGASTINTGNADATNLSSSLGSNAAAIAGDINLITGDTTSSSLLGPNGYSGIINLKTGTGTTRGYIKMDALALQLPTGTTDPSVTNTQKGNLVGGSSYYNSSTNVLRLYNGTTWNDIATGAGSGANTSLSNLTSTSINQDLIPSAIFKSLGSNSLPWYALNMDNAGSGVRFFDTSSNIVTQLSNNLLTMNTYLSASIFSINPNDITWTGAGNSLKRIYTTDLVSSSSSTANAIQLRAGGNTLSGTLNGALNAIGGALALQTGNVSTTNSFGAGAIAQAESADISLTTGDTTATATTSTATYSGLVTLKTGSATTARGYIKMDALAVQLPTGTADPSVTNSRKGNMTGGASYFNTSTNKLRLYDGTSWADVGGAGTVFVGSSYTRNAAQVITPSTSTAVLYNISEYDTNTAFNTGTGIYTIPTTGFYKIGAAASMAHATQPAVIRIVLNASVKAQQQRPAGQNDLDINRTLSLTAGDAISIEVFHSEASNSSVGFSQSSWFNIEKIG